MNDENRTRLYDPNGDLSQSDIDCVRMACGAPFYRCRITPRSLEGLPPTLIYAEMGTRKHVVYVRVTHRVDEEEGTGRAPLILIDAANHLNAEPHVVRVNLTDMGKGTAFHYWGVEELEAELKADTAAWNSILLRGKAMEDYLRLVKDKINRLEVVMDLSRMVKYPPSETGSNAETVDLYGLNTVPRLVVDACPLGLVAVGVIELLRSTRSSDGYWIATCDCGDPGCAGIDQPIDVVHARGHVLWRGYGLRPRRILLFESNQYREAILRGARDFIALYRHHGGGKTSSYFRSLRDVEKALYEAGEKG